MRLVIPTKIQEKEENKESEEENENDNDNGKFKGEMDLEKVSHNAEFLKDSIMKYVNMDTLGESVAVVEEVPMTTPRGKFDFHFLKNLLKIHGNSFDYKISYKNMSRAFMLPKPDGIHIAFVISLVSPLKQGKTTYPYLVFQIKNNQKKKVDLNLPENEEERKKILKSEIPNEIEGQLYDILAKLVKCLIGIRIVIPSNFQR